MFYICLNCMLICDSADFVGVKRNLPPYLDPSLTIDDYLSGVSFASAGAGFDPLTSQISVIFLFIFLSLNSKYETPTKIIILFRYLLFTISHLVMCGRY